MNMTRTKTRRPKYEIPDIGGSSTTEDPQVSRVVNFLVRGVREDVTASAALNSEGVNSNSEPSSPLIPSDETSPPEATKRVSLDHLFSAASTGRAKSGNLSSPAAEPFPSEVPTETDVILGDLLSKPFNFEPPQDQNIELTKEEGNSDSIAGDQPGQSRSRESSAERDDLLTSLPAVTIGAVTRATEEEFSDLEPSADAKARNSFDEFQYLFGKLLKPNLLSICEVIYANTMAIGEVEYLTTIGDLAREVGIKKRFCFVLLNKLEALGFVKRATKQEDKRVLGVILSLNTNPFK
jgi:cell pole-organizing protein PopZ